MLTPAPGPHRARLAAAALMCLVACKRQSPPSPGPIESGPSPPPSPTATYKLTVTELPVVDLGPPPRRPDYPGDRNDPLHYSDGQVAPTEDGGFVLLDHWFAGYAAGRFDVRGFGPDGTQRWQLALIGDVANGHVAGAVVSATRDTAWVSLLVSGTIVLGDRTVAVTTALEKYELVVLRLDLATGRVKGHLQLPSGAPAPGLVEEMGDGLVIFVGAIRDRPPGEQVAPGFSGSLVHVDANGAVAWKVGVDASAGGAHLAVDAHRILFLSAANYSIHVGDRRIGPSTAIGGLSATLCHDGTLADLRPLLRVGFESVALCPHGMCSLHQAEDPTHSGTQEFNRGLHYNDAGQLISPGPPKMTSALTFEQGDDHREHLLDLDDCHEILTAVDDAVLIACGDRVQLRSLDASLLAETPGVVYGEVLRASGGVLVVSRDRREPRRIRRFKVTVEPPATPAGPSGDPAKQAPPATAHAGACRARG